MSKDGMVLMRLTILQQKVDLLFLWMQYFAENSTRDSTTATKRRSIRSQWPRLHVGSTVVKTKTGQSTCSLPAITSRTRGGGIVAPKSSKRKRGTVPSRQREE